MKKIFGFIVIVLFASGLFINAKSIHDTDFNLNSFIEMNNVVLDGAIVPCVDVEETGCKRELTM